MDNDKYIKKAYKKGFLSDKAKNRSVDDLNQHLDIQLNTFKKESKIIRDQFTRDQWNAICYKVKFRIIDLRKIRKPYLFE